MDKRIYPAYKIAMLSSVLREHGVPASALLDGTGLSDNEITSLTTRISQRQLVAAYRNAQNLSQIPYIGLIAGSRLRVTDYGIYGYGLISSANLREALEFSIQYHEMAAPTVRMSLWVEEERGLAVFGLAFVAAAAFKYPVYVFDFSRCGVLECPDEMGQKRGVGAAVGNIVLEGQVIS